MHKCRSLSVVFAAGLLLLIPVMAWSQVSFGVGGENVESESSTIPFKIQLRGVLNGDRPEKTLGRVMLEITDYRENYNFDVTEAKAPDNARITSYSILQKYQHGKRNITLTGSEYWLSKIGQAAPGTPLTILGFLRQRSGTLQLIRVETPAVGKEEKMSEEHSSAVTDQQAVPGILDK